MVLVVQPVAPGEGVMRYHKPVQREQPAKEMLVEQVEATGQPFPEAAGAERAERVGAPVLALPLETAVRA